MISDMTSGECRRVSPERPDLHVYCHNPMRAVTTPDGRQAWRRDEAAARCCVICPDEGFEDYERWISLDEAETIVARVLYGDPRPKKRGARC